LNYSLRRIINHTEDNTNKLIPRVKYNYIPVTDIRLSYLHRKRDQLTLPQIYDKSNILRSVYTYYSLRKALTEE